MHAEKIGEETGQITGTRVLPDEGEGTKVEVSFQANGVLLGVHTTNLGTYTSVMQPDGSLFGDGQGLTLTEDGESAIWHGQGVGRPTGHGMAAAFRGTIYFQTNSKKLARLNGTAVAFEYEADESGKTEDKSYELK
jgi:hypothetical protein